MKKLTIKSQSALILLILGAPFAGVSAAGLIDVHTSDSAKTTTGSATSGNRLGETSDTNTSARTNLNTTTTSARDAGINLSALQNQKDDADSEITGDDVINLDRDNANEDLNGKTNVSRENVHTKSDLKAFIGTELNSDENLSSMTFASDNVDVGYKEHARFFGILPTTLTVHVVAHNDGSTDVSYPWYSFLMITNRSDLEASVKSEVGAFMSQHASVTAGANANANAAFNSTSTSSTTQQTSAVSTQTGWTASARAELAARIEAVLRTHLVGENGNATSTQGSY